jgi:hypothetical protein
MKMYIHKMMLLICAMGLSLPALSAKLPDYYPAAFDRVGVIDQIDLDNRVIVVNDKNIRVALDLKVYTVNTRFASSQSLQPGMVIGFGTSGSRAISGAVSEIWVLPADYTPTQSKAGPVNERRKDRD